MSESGYTPEQARKDGGLAAAGILDQLDEEFIHYVEVIATGIAQMFKLLEDRGMSKREAQRAVYSLVGPFLLPDEDEPNV